MKTPIVDFVKSYAKSGACRFHMPGHKGKDFLGFEKYDITEIAGADVLSYAEGIIKESEGCASSLFKTGRTFYTTEGSSTAICALLALSVKKPGAKILAVRNVHKAFVNACALLNITPLWLMNDSLSHITACKINPEDIENKILNSTDDIAALYLTSPDYLGNLYDIPAVSAICKKYNIPLLVDNAHGAYLAFLKDSLHPIHNGATACCDSAHKTLPVLTGGAYLHIAKDAPKSFFENAREKLALFSSTSPSYLILQSLDLCNKYLSDNFEEKLKECIEETKRTKEFILSKGFAVKESEPLKIVIDAKRSGYTGDALSNHLRKHNIEAEFYDDDFLVLMITPQNSIKDFDCLKNAFLKINPKPEIKKKILTFSPPVTKMSIRDANFCDFETIDVKKSLGRICSAQTISCPPAVPIAVSGEEITENVIELFKAYGIVKIRVIK